MGFNVPLLRRRRASLFTPASLFAGGVQGAWYDPSNFSTMFQDSAGTTPVTAVEQPVGRILDLSGNNNHATQATSAARPVLSARVNLLTRTEEFNDAAWTKRAGSITATTITAPNGTSTADTFSEDSATATHDFFNLAGVAVSATQYIARIYVKPRGRSIVRFTLAAAGVPSGATFNLNTGAVTQLTAGYTASATLDPSGFWLLQLTVTLAASNVFFGVQSSDGTTTVIAGINGPAWDLWGGDLRPTNDGVGLPPYQRVTTATDYDTTGFPFYLRFDGTDDSLVTGTITPGTDKAQVFAGMRKLATTENILTEYSATFSTADCFGIAMPSNLGDTTSRSFIRGGTIQATLTVPASPATGVLFSDLNNSAGTVRTNLNGGAYASASGTASGNFANQPLYVGSRGGTSLRFNGRVFSLIVRFGPTLTDAQITDTQTWVNGKTKAY